MVKATKKQRELIEQIETVLGVEFDGVSKDEASKFIDYHIDHYHKKCAGMQSQSYVIDVPFSNRRYDL
jgi:hypothetical protein